MLSSLDPGFKLQMSGGKKVIFLIYSLCSLKFIEELTLKSFHLNGIKILGQEMDEMW